MHLSKLRRRRYTIKHEHMKGAIMGRPFHPNVFLVVAPPCFLTQAKKVNLTFTRVWVLTFVILGSTLDLFSIFLPWGILAESSTYVYLPGSPTQGNEPLPVTDFLVLMQTRGQLMTASNLIKAAIVLGFVGATVFWFVEQRLLSYGVILTSSCLSLIAVTVLALTAISLSWGAYLALAGGALMVLVVVLKELNVEVIVEREVSAPEE